MMRVPQPHTLLRQLKMQGWTLEKRAPAVKLLAPMQLTPESRGTYTAQDQAHHSLSRYTQHK